jgi:GAF domain-containing protein
MTPLVEINPPVAEFRPVVPPDLNETERLELLEALHGFSSTIDPQLDHFSVDMHQLTGGVMNGVTRVGAGGKLRFPGMTVKGENGQLHFPGVAVDGKVDLPDEYRDMDHDTGFCRHVEQRGTALVIPDVRDYPPFAGNPVVVQNGVRAYYGVPLKLPDERFFGTIWSVDKEPRPDWDDEHKLIEVKDLGLHIVEYILSQSPEFN